ncbi:efflux RND transporter permease subunit [Teredinibacter turnerae]|uniref:efflux RND transporter permease subunit n=1 Tax=Teredinibacter turnerae TaxID=2426 RepID=UPI0003AAB6C0
MQHKQDKSPSGTFSVPNGVNWLKSHFRFNLLATLLCITLGVFQALNLPVSLYPAVDKPTIRLIVPLLEDSADFYSRWGVRLEKSLSALENVEYVEGTYREGRAIIFVRFKWNVTPKSAKQEVSTVASFYQAQLPSIWPSIRVDFSDPGSENYVAFMSDKYTASELSDLLKMNLLPKLEAIDGVASAWVSDKTERYIEVELRPYDLINTQISLEQVKQSLQNHAYNKKLGVLKTQTDGKVTVTLSSDTDSLQKIGNITLTSISGQAIKLSEVANVGWGQEESVRTFLYNKDEAIAVAIWPDPDANIYRVSEEFLKHSMAFSEQVGNLVVLNAPIDFIEESIYNILFALCLGMLTAALVVFIFYKSLSSTMLICFSMPGALCLALLAMYLSGVGINLISLGAMSLCIGMVVDGSIISVDRINLKIGKQSDKGIAKDKIASVLEAVWEVRPSVISSTLTSIIVFMPLAYTDPAIASILRDTVYVTISILISSVFISLVVIPSIYIWFFTGSANTEDFVLEDITWQESNKSNGHPPSDKLRASVLYLNFLCHNTSRKTIILFGFIAVTLFTIAVFPSKIRQELIAQPRAEIIDIEIIFATEGMDKDQKNDYINPIKYQIERLAGDKIKYIYTDIRKDIAYLSLHLKSYRHFDSVMNTLRIAIDKNELPELNITPWITSSLKLKEPPSLQLSFNATNEELNRTYMSTVLAFLKKNQNIVRTAQYPSDRQTKLVKFSHTQNGEDAIFGRENYETSLQSLSEYVRHAIEAQKLYDVEIDAGLRDLKLSVETEQLGVEGVLHLPWQQNGNTVFVGQLVNAEIASVWREFFSVNARKSYRLDVWVKRDISLNEIALLKQQITTHLKSTHHLNMAPLTFEDTADETRSALKSIRNALAFSVGLVFLVLLHQFKKIELTLIVISVVPLGVCGAILGLFAFGSTLSLNSFLGMLILAGLTVNNSILLLDAFERFMAMGLDKMEAIARSISVRTRSLIVTNLTTVVAMTPLAIGFGPGKDILQPLGISLAFGLMFAAAGTLIIIPILLSFEFSAKLVSTQKTLHS